MLRRKLKIDETEVASCKKSKDSEDLTNQPVNCENLTITFEPAFYEKIWNLELELTNELKLIDFKKDKNISAVYNPLVYAAELHVDYLKKYLKKSPTVLFLGMNPGLNGMVQTSVPFGYVPAVKNWLKIEGNVYKPDTEIPSKPVEGFNCTKEEPSGKRFWGVLQELCGEPDNFFKHCFVHNICPLAFLSSSGRNITPPEIKGEAKGQLNTVCLKYLKSAIDIFNPKIIVSIGSYANDRVKELKKKNLISDSIECKLLAHPSPRALNNQDWVDKAKKWFVDNDIAQYFKSN